LNVGDRFEGSGKVRSDITTDYKSSWVSGQADECGE
jgi:hypothetical protein